MTTLNRRSILKMAGATGAMMAAPAILRAQEAFPSRPINVVVPFDTGGYNDRLARAYAPYLQETLGQPLVIVNRGGAGALLGHTYFMQQPADGYTILCSSPAPYLPLNILTQDAQFKVSDFYMINTPSRDYTLMTTAKETGITSVQEVIAKLQADPGSLSIGIQPASGDLVNMMLFAEANGIDGSGLTLVTYSGGGPARNATAGAVVDIGMVGGQGFIPLAEQVTPLLVFDDAPRDGWDAPIVTDISGDDAQFVAGSQRGWGVHAALLEAFPDRYEIILNAIESVSKDPAVIEALTAQDLASNWYGPESSNESIVRTSEVMAQHLDLLQGS
jgi:putative tricarboxylic transport membrane protein